MLCEVLNTFNTQKKKLTKRKYTKKQEYWPASGKYDKKTVIESIKII